MSLILCLATFVLILALLHVPISCEDSQNAKISSALNSVFASDKGATRNILVEFKEKPSKSISLFSTNDFNLLSDDAQVDLHKRFVDQLKLHRDNSQKKALALLQEKAPEKFESFWVSNKVFVTDASHELCDELAKIENVESISVEKIYRIHDPIGGNHIVDESREGRIQEEANAVEWNVLAIKADKSWGNGNTGQGVVVGVIDTGVNKDHECFKNKNIEFFDAVNGKKSAYDDNGHGSHVCGTIAGANGIGVAKDASLVVCKACDGDGGCRASDLTNCCQIMTERRPHCVSNSWGGPSDFGEKSAYREEIMGWNSNGIAAFFSAGNSGSKCETVGSPGDYKNVVSVGAVDKSRKIASFSSRGPCQSGAKCPDVSAPGVDVKSAWMGGSTKYNTISGTSMACPHVAGMYALMKSENPKITVSQATAAIINSCLQNGLADTSQTCGGTSTSEFPNNMYGNGEIDCTRAAKAAKSFAQQNEERIENENAKKHSHKSKKRIVVSVKFDD